MSQRLVQRGAVMVCMFAGLAALSVRKEVAAGAGTGHFDQSKLVRPESAAAPSSDSAGSNGISSGPHTFSMQYDYCYVDAEGRPMVFHRRRLVFFVPDSPPQVLDRTFIETDLCQ